MRRSPLWRHFATFRLVENMRARQAVAAAQEPGDEQQFADWLLQLGEGRLPTDEDGAIQLPAEMCMAADPEEVIRWVFGDLHGVLEDPGCLANRAVLAARNIEVDAVNDLVTAAFPGEATQLLSADALVGDAQELPVPQST